MSCSSARLESISTRVSVSGPTTASSSRLSRSSACPWSLEIRAISAGRRLGTVAAGPPALHPGRALGHQPLERAVGIGPGQPGRPGDGVAGPGSAGQQDLVDQTLGRGEAEMGEIDGRHGS